MRCKEKLMCSGFWNLTGHSCEKQQILAYHATSLSKEPCAQKPFRVSWLHKCSFCNNTIHITHGAVLKESFVIWKFGCVLHKFQYGFQFSVGWSAVWTLQPHLWHMMHSCDMARQTKMCLKGVSRNAYSDADWVTPWVCLMLEKCKILQCKYVKSISQLLCPNADACITVGKVQVLVACWLTCCTRNPVAQVWLLGATGWRTLF